MRTVIGTHRIVSKYLNDDATVHVMSYGGNIPAILLADAETGEPLSKATINLAEYGVTPQAGHVILRAGGEGEGMPEALVALGLIGPAVRTIPYGPYDSVASEHEALGALRDAIREELGE